MKRAISVWLILAASILVVGVAAISVWYWIGMRAIDAMRLGFLEEDVGQPFDRLMEKAFGLIRERDGFIPSDPYRALLDSGKVECFEEFFVVGRYIIRFDFHSLPVRIDPDLTRNRRMVLFWMCGPDDEIWVCYTDGIRERWLRRGQLVKVRDGTLRLVRDWERPPCVEGENLRLLVQAGYPEWRFVEEKEMWIKANGHRLEWNAKEGMYCMPGSVLRPGQ